VTIADVALEAIKTPLVGIEHMASAILNLVGALFYALGHTDGHFYQNLYPFRDCSPKDAIHHSKWSLANLYCLPIVPIISAIQLIYQLGAALKDPVNIQSIAAYPYLTTYK
ncbi:MAG: hypothetical protein K2X08_04945, partial [Chlamydiales bacterium]|nr:hypothetical protein [Chlamydiales bacterium]